MTSGKNWRKTESRWEILCKCVVLFEKETRARPEPRRSKHKNWILQQKHCLQMYRYAESAITRGIHQDDAGQKSTSDICLLHNHLLRKMTLRLFSEPKSNVQIHASAKLCSSPPNVSFRGTRSFLHQWQQTLSTHVLPLNHIITNLHTLSLAQTMIIWRFLTGTLDLTFMIFKTVSTLITCNRLLRSEPEMFQLTEIKGSTR